MTLLSWAGFFHPRAWGGVGGAGQGLRAHGRKSVLDKAGVGSGGAGRLCPCPVLLWKVICSPVSDNVSERSEVWPR